MNAGHDLAIVIPLWRRTKNITRVHESAVAATPLAHVVFVVSDGDEPVRNFMADYEAEHVVVDGVGGEKGDYARKINAGYRATTEPFIFTGADDIVFDPGWYPPARALMSNPEHSTQVLTGGATLTGPFELTHGPHIGVVGTVDSCNDRTMRGEHSTHSLVARWYADQGATIDKSHEVYSEVYPHEYCDDELCRLSMKRESYAHSFESLVRHEHWNVDAKLDDEVYRHGRAWSRLSRRIFLQRRRMWGDG